MHADLMLLQLSAPGYLWIMTDFHEEVKAGQTSCQSHYYLLLWVILVQLNIVVWATFSRYFLLDAFSLHGLYNSNRSLQTTSGITAASWQTINHLSSLIIERAEFMLTESTRTTILPVQIYEYHALLLSAKLNSRASQKSYHNCISEIKVSLADWAFHGKDSDDKVYSYLKANYSSTQMSHFCHMIIRKYPETLDDHNKMH